MNKKNRKQVKCLKCKKKFITEIDSLGIPYKKICNLCKKKSFNKHGRGVIGKI